MKKKINNWNNVNYLSGFLNKKQETEKNNLMNRKRAYWLSQFIGWGTYAIFNIVLFSLIDHFDFRKVIIVLYACFTGLMVTHIFRSIIKNLGWVSLQLKKLIPRLIISSIINGTIIYSAVLIVDLTSHVDNFSKFKSALSVAGVFQFSIIIFLWELIYFLVHFFENYKKAEIESYIWEAAVKDYELKTLKSQLNPHFMFNALNSIRALIGVDPENAKVAVTKLSNLLRYSLKMERIESVTLQEEIQTVSDYLALEKMRFEERLKYEINIDPATSKIEIPPMMIQTLAENGIKHGISKCTEGGNISITSSINDSRLHINIRNTGQINKEAIMQSSGFGISNTKHRLHLLYGEHASFNIKNISDNEVLTELIIPIGGIKNESFNN